MGNLEGEGSWAEEEDEEGEEEEEAVRVTFIWVVFAAPPLQEEIEVAD